MKDSREGQTLADMHKAIVAATLCRMCVRHKPLCNGWKRRNSARRTLPGSFHKAQSPAAAIVAALSLLT